MSTITIHGFAPSTYTRSARMAAIEKGVAHDLAPVAFGEPSHLALHPFGKIPAMTHGDITVIETPAIMAYIDATFDGPRLFPTKGAAFSRTLSAISVALDYAYRPVVHTEMADGRMSDDHAAAVKRVFDWLDGCLSGNNYVADGQMTAADLLLAPMVAYHVEQIGDRHVTADRPALKAWLEAMTGRASYVETAANAR